MLAGSGIFSTSALTFPSQCESVCAIKCFHVSRTPLALSAYTVPSHAPSTLMSLAMLPGQSLHTIGTNGQMMVPGHFWLQRFLTLIQSVAYCDGPTLNRCEPEPNMITVPAGRNTFSKISADRSASSFRVGFSALTTAMQFSGPPAK
jgi:hypothetical protein